MIKNCNTCGKEFEKKPNVSKKNWANSKYCSRKCANIAVGENRRYKLSDWLKNNGPRTHVMGSNHYRWKGGLVKKKCLRCDGDFEVKWLRRETAMFCSIQCHAKYRNKGLSSENSRIRVTKEYIEWRKNVFKRDNFTCQLCGIKGVTLNADHIKSFSGHPELRFELSNGRTLCIACHKKTDNYGSKARLKK